MKIYYIEPFKTQLDKLRSKKSYNTLDKLLVNYFFDKSNDFRAGTLLNNNPKIPYIKKRLGGSGGYRVYYLLYNECSEVYLIYVHPKTSPLGERNINDQLKTDLYKKVFEAIKNNKTFEFKP